MLVSQGESVAESVPEMGSGEATRRVRVQAARDDWNKLEWCNGNRLKR